MAAPADTPAHRRHAGPPVAPSSAPSGGWRTIAAKEFADHLGSVRFFVLLDRRRASRRSCRCTSSPPTSATPRRRSSGTPALFLAAVRRRRRRASAASPTVAFAALLVPLVGIAFGFDGINCERAQGTLSRLLAQPIHRDDVINGKFAAGIAVIALMLAALVVLVDGARDRAAGDHPRARGARPGRRVAARDDPLRVVLARVRAAAVGRHPRRRPSPALVGFGSWLGLILFGQFLLPLIAELAVPGQRPRHSPTTTSRRPRRSSCSCGSRRPSLYQDIVTRAHEPDDQDGARLRQPRPVRSATQEQLPTLLSLDQSMLLVWPQIVVLTALTVAMFALAYVLFLRQEVRA